MDDWHLFPQEVVDGTPITDPAEERYRHIVALLEGMSLRIDALTEAIDELKSQRTDSSAVGGLTL